MRRTNEYTNKILYYKISRSPEKSIRNPCFMHHRPLSVPRVSRFARTRIQEYCSVQRYSRYSSPLRNGKDGTGRGGSGELVIKEGELGCVPFRGRPVRLKLSNFTPRVPSFLPWLPATLVVCPTDSLRWCRNSFFEYMLLFPLLFTIEVGYANGRRGTLVYSKISIRSDRARFCSL